MFVLLLICVAAFFILVWHSRLTTVSLGLPIAYLFSLLFQYLPGAFAHLVGGNFFADSTATEIGLRLTTIGTVFFVIGVMVAQRGSQVGKTKLLWKFDAKSSAMALYCLFGGWIMLVVTVFLHAIPSLGAAIEKSSTIWIFGVLIGFLIAVRQGRYFNAGVWLAALSAYPLYVLIWAGFLSFGSTSVFVVFSALLISLKSHLRAYVSVLVFSLLCLLVFMSYHQNRNDFREAVWGGAGLDQRVSSANKIITGLTWFDSLNADQLNSLDERMNQCEFVGLAAQNIASGGVSFLHGRSIWEGLQALVPRVIWPEKPIFAGSSQFVREFCGKEVNETTSYGVGQVMELYINFGIPSLVVGFFLFGLAYGWVDRKAAAAVQTGNFATALFWFLPAVGMNAPLASIAEVMGNVAAAVIAGIAYLYVFRMLGFNASATRGKSEFVRRSKTSRPTRKDSVTESKENI